MIEADANFWQEYEDNSPRPLETAISKNSPDVAVDFIRGGIEIFSAVALVNPDVLFLPERGAGPFSWMIEFLEEREDRSFYKVPLMIGTETETVSGVSHGQIRPVKRMNVKRGIEIAFSNLGSIKKPMLIDEVQFGGTIKLATNYLHLGLREMGIRVPIYLVAVQNTTEGSDERKRAKGYKTLISNSRPGIRATTIDSPLFLMDNQIFLNHQLVDYPRSQVNSRPLPMLFHNTEAEKTIKNLTLSYVNPNALNEALSAVQSNTAPSTDDGQKLYSWIQEFLASLNEKSWITRDEAIDWLWEFHDRSSQKDPSDLTALVN